MGDYLSEEDVWKVQIDTHPNGIKGFVQRKIVKTSVSLICQFLTKSIHTLTAKGFELKIMLFIFAVRVNLWVAT
jgi:hypothetical protein